MLTGPSRLFRFEGRSSLIRRWDIRCRIVATAGISACLLAAPAPALAPLGLGVVTLLALARSTPGEIVQVVRGFLAFLIFFIGLGVLFEPTWSQAAFLAVQAVRLTLLLLLGHFLFLAATPGDVTEGIRWSLRWLGRRRAWLGANLATWALASVPLILDQAATLNEAAVLRGHSSRRHPVGALKLLTLALLVRTVERSTSLTSALEARGFGTTVPPPRLKAKPRDGALLVAVAAWCAVSWVFGSIVSP